MADGKVIKLGILLELLDKVTGPGKKISNIFKDVEKTASLADRAVERAKKNWGAGWRLAATGGALAAPFVLLGKSLIDVNAELERYKIQLVTAKGGNEAAGQALLDWAKKFSAKTPFKISEVTQATAMLEIYGLSAQKWLPLIGNMAGSMGKNVVDATMGVAKALKGGGFDILRESYGLTGQTLMEYGFKGKMQTPGDLVNLGNALEKFINTKFAGGMDKMAKSWTGLKSMISDFIFQMKAFAGAEPFEKLKAKLAGFVSLIQSPAFMESASRWAMIFGDAFSTIIDWTDKLLKPLMAIIGRIDKLTKTHPALLKYALAFSFIGAMSLIALGGILMFASGFGFMIAAIMKTIVYMKQLQFILFAVRYFASLAGASIVSAIGQATAAVWAFLTTNPIGWIILAISAIVMFALAWKNNWLGIGTFMNKVVAGIASGFVWLWNQIMAGVNWIISLPGKLYEAGRKMVLSIWEGIKSVAMWPVKAMTDIVTKLRRLLPFSPAKEGPLRDLDKSGLAFSLQIAHGLEKGKDVIRKAAIAGLSASFTVVPGYGISSTRQITKVHEVNPPFTQQYFKDIAAWNQAKQLEWYSSHLMSAHGPGSGSGGQGVEINRDTGGGTGLDNTGNLGSTGNSPGGMISYFTNHFERDSIQIRVDHLDFKSFVDKVSVAVVKKIYEG